MNTPLYYETLEALARRERRSDLTHLVWWGIATILVAASVLLLVGAA